VHNNPFSENQSLPQWVIEDLAKSELTSSDFPIIFLETEEQLNTWIHRTTFASQRIIDIGAYVIKYPNIPNYRRLKLRTEVDGCRYLSPDNADIHIYIPQHILNNLERYKGQKLIIDEGEKKAALLAKLGFFAVGISGVWMYSTDKLTLLPELREFILSNKIRECLICFDSDVTTNPAVIQAELRLAVMLLNEFEIVCCSTRIPQSSDNKKNGIDDYVVQCIRELKDENREIKAKETFQTLLNTAQPTFEICFRGDIIPQYVIREISSIVSPVHREGIVKRIAKKAGISVEVVRESVNFERATKGEVGEGLADGEERYTAVFDDLVDLVEHEGRVTFLVKNEDKLEVKHSVTLNDVKYCPPPREQIPFKSLPRAVEVLRYYGVDSDSKLYDDLFEYHKGISELPSDDYYNLLVMWDFHTYLLEPVQYSPYIWFYAIPERGKSRTGKGCIYVAYRGIHVESLRDAYLIRVANDLKATIFFDVMELWRKAEKAGSEDILLQRIEKGAVVPKVLYPERGAHQDTKYFNIFGPTIIGTNEPVHPILETRAVLISMPETSKRFEEDVPPERGLPLKERLVAFLARHLGKELPDLRKPVRGRLGDIMKSLLQIVRLVKPEREESFRKLIGQLEQERNISKSDSLEASLLLTLIGLEHRVEDGLLSIKTITDAYNESVHEKFHTSTRTVGWRLKAMGFQKRKRNNGAFIKWDERLVKTLSIRFGLMEDNADDGDKENTDGHADGDDEGSSGDVCHDRGETSQERHSQNACKQRGSDVSDVFPRGIDTFQNKTGTREKTPYIFPLFQGKIVNGIPAYDPPTLRKGDNGIRIPLDMLSSLDHSDACDCSVCCPDTDP
jgi:hypothetical protein